MYAYTGANFSTDAWFDAVKRGRTFVTNGPMLTLTVDERMPGDELKVNRNATLHVRAQGWAPAEIGSPKTVELIVSGGVAAKKDATKRGELTFDTEFRATSSEWIAARVTAENGAIAHTSPVYVVVGGKSFRDQEQLQELVAKRLERLDFI